LSHAKQQPVAIYAKYMAHSSTEPTNMINSNRKSNVIPSKPEVVYPGSSNILISNMDVWPGCRFT